MTPPIEGMARASLTAYRPVSFGDTTEAMSDKHPQPANVLIVEDDHIYAEKIIAPHFTGNWHVQIAHNVPQSLQAAEQLVNLRLAIVDLDIPGGALDVKVSGGAGFEVMEVIKERFPQARVVVLTAHLTAMLVNKAQSMGVEYVAKGNCTKNLKSIATSLREQEKNEGNMPVIRVAKELAESAGLSERQTEVLLLAVRNFSREEIAKELGIGEWTLKSHLRQILKRTEYSRLQPLLRMIFRSAQEL